MFPLFLETHAVAQIRAWCQQNDIEGVEKVIENAYKNACKHSLKIGGGFDGLLFKRHVDTDDHQDIDINLCFNWAGTPEGWVYWNAINKVRVPKGR